MGTKIVQFHLGEAREKSKGMKKKASIGCKFAPNQTHKRNFPHNLVTKLTKMKLSPAAASFEGGERENENKDSLTTQQNDIIKKAIWVLKIEQILKGKLL